MAIITQDAGYGVTEKDHNFTNIKIFQMDNMGNITVADQVNDGGVFEAIITVIQPVRYLIRQNGTSGIVLFWSEGRLAADLQAEVRALGTINGIDLSNITITERDISGGSTFL